MGREWGWEKGSGDGGWGRVGMREGREWGWGKGESRVGMVGRGERG